METRMEPISLGAAAAALEADGFDLDRAPWSPLLLDKAAELLEETRMEGTRVPLGETHSRSRKTERPDPEWIRGSCPVCKGDLVSNAYYVGGQGYIILWQCWESLGSPEERTCDYQRVL